MGLDRTQLRADLLEMMDRAVQEEWQPQQTADWLSTAIDRFVRSGSVTGVEVDVGDGTRARQVDAGRVQ